MDRRLAAILYADVAGYSRLTGADEEGTHATLKDHLGALTDAIVGHGGRVCHFAGDAVLAEFGSVVTALRCAVGAQRDLAERDREVPERRKLRFRMGVNLGDLIADGQEIYGNGVNVAARLESLAEPGGICISGRVLEQVKGNVDVGFADLGPQTVKNIEKPVNVYKVLFDPEMAGKVIAVEAQRARVPAWGWAVAALALVVFSAAGFALWPSPSGRGIMGLAPDSKSMADILAMPTGPSIAVLPFDNLSGDPSQEFFSDGITEEIITALTRFRDLRVLARNTTFRYKGQAVDVKQLARELGMDYVLEGSVRRSVDTIRVTAQLIKGVSGAHLWADTYEAELTPANIFQVQTDITNRVVTAIGSSFGGAIASQRLKDSRGRPPRLLSSYDCVLRATEWARSLSAAAVKQAYACLKHVVEADPNYASAWAMLSWMYALDYLYEFGLDEGNSYDPRQLALDAARRAADIEPDSSLAYLALARAYLYNGELQNFYAAAERALSLNPNDNYSLGTLGTYIAYTGRWQEGEALTKKAIALISPTEPPKWWYWPWAKDHFRKGEYKEALAGFQRNLVPGFWVSQLVLAYTYGWLGDQVEAQKAVAKLRELKPGCTIEDAVRFYRVYGFEDSYIDRMVEGLRRAGLPERASNEVPVVKK
jgi:adenylate cyclase